MFTIVHAMVRGLPIDDRERIVSINARTPPGRQLGASYLDFEDWRAAAKTFSGLAAFSLATATLGDDGRARLSARRRATCPRIRFNCSVSRRYSAAVFSRRTIDPVHQRSSCWATRSGRRVQRRPDRDRPHGARQRCAGDRDRRDAGWFQVPVHQRRVATAGPASRTRQSTARRTRAPGVRRSSPIERRERRRSRKSRPLRRASRVNIRTRTEISRRSSLAFQPTSLPIQSWRH